MVARIDVRLSVGEKDRLRRAAEATGVSLATFVREAAVRGADVVLASAAQEARVGPTARLRGRATARLSTDEIMRLMRDV